MGGMWGLKRTLNRTKSDLVYNKIVDKEISKDDHTHLNSRGLDQLFLSEHVYTLLVNDSIIHDSYRCKYYPNTLPFPSRRIGSCFIGTPGFYYPCSNATERKLEYYICPEECRPSSHKDWIYC